jgi:hypothetical protein
MKPEAQQGYPDKKSGTPRVIHEWAAWVRLGDQYDDHHYDKDDF